MPRLIFFLLFCLFTNICLAQAQKELNQTASGDLIKAEKELNIIYLEILKDYKEDEEFTGNLKAAQKMWTKFRDLEFKVKYPTKAGSYGSVQGECSSMYLTELTEQRIKTLKVWLTGTSGKYPCAGSVKTN